MVICTVSNNNYKKGAQTLFYSIKKNNPHLDIKTILLSYDIKECRHADGIINYDKNIIKDLRKLPTKVRLAYSWDKFLIWRYFHGTERVLCVDSDMLCTGKIDYLNTQGLDEYDFIGTKKNNWFNCGIFMLNRPDKETFNTLYDLAINYQKNDINVRAADEPIINYWIKEHGINYYSLPFEEYNNNDAPGKEIDEKTKFIHFIWHKPFLYNPKANQNYYNEWKKYYDEAR